MTPPRDPAQLDVDVRFLLANERTLLAWLRTALTLQAAGVALIHLAGRAPVMSAFGLGLLGLGAATAIAGYLRGRAAERAIRAGQLPPRGRGPAWLTAGVVVLASGLVLVYAFDLR